MATDDPDGLILQALSDRLTCLGMEMAEHLREARERFAHVLPEDPTSTEENR